MSTTNILDLNNRIDELEKNSGGGGSADSAKRSDIATEFSTETSYTAGNFVYYEGKLYQFNADHSAGAWDPTDVVEANVTDQIVSNKAAIEGLTASDIMMSDGVTSVEDRLDIKTIDGTYTTDSYGRFTIASLDNKNVNILRAYVPDDSYIVTPYNFYNSTTQIIVTYFKITRSDTTAYTVIASTNVTIHIDYLEF